MGLQHHSRNHSLSISIKSSVVILSWLKSAWVSTSFQPEKLRNDVQVHFLTISKSEPQTDRLPPFGSITNRGNCEIVRYYCIVGSLSKSKSFQALLQWVNSRTWITSAIWITLQRLNLLHFSKVLFLKTYEFQLFWNPEMLKSFDTFLIISKKRWVKVFPDFPCQHLYLGKCVSLTLPLFCGISAAATRNIHPQGLFILPILNLRY